MWCGRSRLALSLAVLGTGCASNNAPPGFLPSPSEAGTTARGGWIQVTLRDATAEVNGELLAVSPDSIWILTPSGATALATSRVTGGKLTAYLSQQDKAAVFTILGVASTLSNGWYLIFTAPLWIVTGTFATADQSRVPQHQVPPLGWPDLALFARFPQGLPPDLAWSELHLETGTRP
jgi:hypothetical protein